MTGVVRVDDHLLPALTRFLQQTWDPQATLEGVRASRAALADQNLHGKGLDVPTFLFMKDGEPIGHLGSIPIMLQLDGQVTPVHWLKGLMVLPEARNGPVGFLLVKGAAEALGFTMALVVKPDARRLFTALRFSEAGGLGDFIRILDGRAIAAMDFGKVGTSRGAAWLSALQRVHVAQGAGWALQGALNLVAATVGRGSAHVVVASPAELSPEALDALWERCRGSLRAAPMRDARYLAQRYRDDAYVAALASDGDGPCALAILKRPGGAADPRLAGVRVATLSDVLAATTPGALAAIGTLERRAVAEGAHAVICGASHVKLRAWLRRRAFLPLGARARFLVRSPEPVQQLPPFQDWWLTRGDSNADEGF